MSQAVKLQARVLASLAFLVLSLPGIALAVTGDKEKRVALVIGNSEYTHWTRLRNPIPDATAVHGVLERHGFQSTFRANLNHREMVDALRDFRRDINDADVGAFYYAGHAAEAPPVENDQDARIRYLIPIDAEHMELSDFAWDAIPLSRVYDEMSDVRRLRLVMIDGCRDDPFESQLDYGSTRGLRIGGGLLGDEARGRDKLAVFYSASSGQEAADGGSMSPFAQSLTAHIRRRWISLNQVAEEVEKEVLASTGGEQRPEYYFSPDLADTFLFRASEPRLGALPPDPKPSRGDPITWKDQTVEYRYVDEDIQQVLVNIIEMNGMLPIITDRVSGKVSGHIQNVPVRRAFMKLIQENGLDYRYSNADNVIRVFKQEEVRKEFVLLNYAEYRDFHEAAQNARLGGSYYLTLGDNVLALVGTGGEINELRNLAEVVDEQVKDVAESERLLGGRDLEIKKMELERLQTEIELRRAEEELRRLRMNDDVK